MKKLALLISLLILCAGAAAQSKQSQQPATGMSATADARKRAFEIVWQTVKEKHFDPTFGGVDWDKVKAQYEPRISAAKSDAEFYQLLQSMLGELGQSHFNIIPPEAIVADEPGGSQEGGIGIDLRVIDNRAVITRVEPGSKAALAGLRAGFVITEVGQRQIASIIEKIAKSNLPTPTKSLYATRAALSLVEGTPGTSAEISYLDERDRVRKVAVEREPMKGEMSPAFGNFPPQRTEFEARRLEGGIGYIRFNIFVQMLLGKIHSAIRQMNDAPGIIIDLRGNPGGLGGMSYGIARVLETRKTSLGVMKMRAGELNFVVLPQEGAYTGPVVILIDGLSASTSEIFAAGMQENGRAKVVGERSAGAALPSIIQKLPTGALFQYAVADYKTPKGVLIEGRGVTPDVEVKLTRQALIEGRDSQLEAAIKEATSKK